MGTQESVAGSSMGGGARGTHEMFAGSSVHIRRRGAFYGCPVQSVAVFEIFGCLSNLPRTTKTCAGQPKIIVRWTTKNPTAKITFVVCSIYQT